MNNLQKGLAPIITILVVAFFGMFAAPVLVESLPPPTPSASPTPTPTEEPTNTPEPTATSSPEVEFHTSLPENQSLDIDKGNSQVHVQNTGNGSVIHVETSGEGSADVDVHSHFESSSSVTSSSTLEVSGSSN